MHIIWFGLVSLFAADCDHFIAQLATSDLQTGIPGQKAESHIGELPNRPGSALNAPAAMASTSAAETNVLQASTSSWGGDDLMDVNSGGDDWGAFFRGLRSA